MLAFLDSIPAEDLAVLLRRRLGGRPNVRDLPRDRIYRALFALDGFDLLRDKKLRQLLVLNLPDGDARHFAEQLRARLEGMGEPTAYDVAIAVSQVPWRVGSRVTWAFASRFGVPVEFLPERSLTLTAIESVEPFTPAHDLFDYQEEIAGRLGDLLSSSSPVAGLVQLPTGSGKTRTAIECIVAWMNSQETQDRRRGALWLAHTEELCEQAAEAFLRAWMTKGEYPTRLVRFWGEHQVRVEEMRESFVVAGYQKLSRFLDDDAAVEGLRETVGLLVVDEAHKALAPTIRTSIKRLRARGCPIHLLGLTATPGRSRSEVAQNRELAEMFDRRLVVSAQLGPNPIRTLQERGILARVERSERTGAEVHLGEQELHVAQQFGDLPSTILRRLAQNETRNEVILDLLRDQAARDRPTLVFACTVAHARELAARLALDGIAAASVDCGLHRSTRRRIVNGFRRGEVHILLNFGVLSTGFDAPNVKTVVITRPTTSVVLYSQMVGRGLRGLEVGGTPDCLLVDIRDNFADFGLVSEVYSYFDEYWDSSTELNGG